MDLNCGPMVILADITTAKVIVVERRSTAAALENTKHDLRLTLGLAAYRSAA